MNWKKILGLVAVGVVVVAGAGYLWQKLGQQPNPEETYAVVVSSHQGPPPAVDKGEISENALPEQIAYDVLTERAEIPENNVTKLFYENATIPKFKDAIERIDGWEDKNDRTIIFLDGLGEKDYFYFQEEGHARRLSYENIDNIVDQIDGKTFVIADACFSGTAIEPLEEGPGPRVVITPSSSSEKTGSWSSMMTYFPEALTGPDPAYTHPPFRMPIYSPTADYNGDGKVSFREAFDFAKEQIQAFDNELDNDIEASVDMRHPQISDPENITPTEFLDINVEPVEENELGLLYEGEE